MTAVSTNYRELLPSEVEAVAKECAEAWKSPEIPLRQYEACVKGELERFRAGQPIAPFDALIRCWKQIPWAAGYFPTLLDVGASSGYYREVLKIAGYDTYYTGCDFSESFVSLARHLNPGLPFEVADARNLPYVTDKFDVVLSSACIMHVRDYEQVIRECARVASRWVILNRTPITLDASAKYYEKEAYGVKTLEIHFNLSQLLAIFAANNLALRHTEPIFWDEAQGYGHVCYLLENVSLAHYPA